MSRLSFAMLGHLQTEHWFLWSLMYGQLYLKLAKIVPKAAYGPHFCYTSPQTTTPIFGFYRIFITVAIGVGNSLFVAVTSLIGLNVL